MDGMVMPVLLEAGALETRERIGDLFDRHHARLYRLACRISGDSEDARDLVQEAFLRAARHPQRIPLEPSRAEAWLVCVLVNLCRDRSRRRRVRRASLDGGLAAGPGPRPAPEPQVDPMSELVLASAVRSAIAELPPRQRAVVALHELEDVPVPEVASLLGMSAVTVRWHLSIARRRLRRKLGPGAGGRPR